jgi:hypothetical protein
MTYEDSFAPQTLEEQEATPVAGLRFAHGGARTVAQRIIALAVLTARLRLASCESPHQAIASYLDAHGRTWPHRDLLVRCLTMSLLGSAADKWSFARTTSLSRGHEPQPMT